MSVNDSQQALTKALTSQNSKEVLQILHETESFTGDMLSQCLLYYVKEACQNSVSKNSSEILVSHMNRYDIVYMLIDSGADVDKIDENGNTCLFYATLSENYQLSDILLQCGADMWADTEYGLSVYDYVSKKSISQDMIDIFNKFHPGLWKAVECEDIYQVRQLINYWCRTNLKKNGLTLKDIALQTGNEEIINLILGVWESMDLVFHILAKNTEAVKKKLESCKKKIRLNFRKMSDHGAPILYYLIQSKDISIIELFIKHDCQIYTIMRDQMGDDMPVLFSALTPDMSVNVLEALLPKNKTQTEEILHKIIYKGMTVLEVAIKKNVNPEIFKLLIDRGGPALLCDHNQFNKSVLDVAISLAAQPYIDAVDQCVYDWIHHSSQYGDRRLKLALLGWKFEPIHYVKNGKKEENIKKFLSDTVLLQAQIEEMSFAIENGDIQKFIDLKSLVYDSKLCETNMLWYARVLGDGMPLLHTAVLFNRPEIVEIILEDKPSKESIDNLFDQYHRTALHYAFACSSTKKIKNLLLSYGCSEHVLDKINKEPLDFKEKQDSPCIIQMIDHLKFKNFSEYEPDPWSTCVVNAFSESSEGNYSETENFSNDFNNEYEFYQDANSDCDEKESGYFFEETDDDVEEENRSRCLIS